MLRHLSSRNLPSIQPKEVLIIICTVLLFSIECLRSLRILQQSAIYICFCEGLYFVLFRGFDNYGARFLLMSVGQDVGVS